MSKRQQQVLEGVCEGLRNQDIAIRLRVSEGAVKATLQQLFRKMSVEGALNSSESRSKSR